MEVRAKRKLEYTGERLQKGGPIIQGEAQKLKEGKKVKRVDDLRHKHNARERILRNRIKNSEHELNVSQRRVKRESNKRNNTIKVIDAEA